MENQVNKKQTWMNVSNGKTIIDSLKIEGLKSSEPPVVNVSIDMERLCEVLHNGSLSICEEIKNGLAEINSTIKNKEMFEDSKNIIDLGKELTLSVLQATNNLEELAKNVDLMQAVYQTKCNEIISHDTNLRKEVNDSKINIKVSMRPLLICLYLMLGVLTYLAIKA